MKDKRDLIFRMLSCTRTAIDANQIFTAGILAIFVNVDSLAKSIELEKKLRQNHETCIPKDKPHQLRPAFRQDTLVRRFDLIQDILDVILWPFIGNSTRHDPRVASR